MLNVACAKKYFMLNQAGLNMDTASIVRPSANIRGPKQVRKLSALYVKKERTKHRKSLEFQKVKNTSAANLAKQSGEIHFLWGQSTVTGKVVLG